MVERVPPQGAPTWWEPKGTSEPPAEKLTLYNLRKHIHSAKPLVHVRIPLMEALLARCPLYSFSLSTANQQHGHVIVPKKLIADCFEYIDQTTTGDKGLMHSNHMQSSMRGLGSQTSVAKPTAILPQDRFLSRTDPQRKRATIYH